jgi:hypothetical protein
VRRILTLICLTLATLANADDAYWSAVGSAGAFAKSKDIRMESEDVRISLHYSFMHIRAVFNFKNDGRAQTVTTAFPELMVDYTKRSDTAPISISHFKCWVDGEAVPVARKSMPLPKISDYSNYSAVWLKKVSFAAKGNRQVVCEYDSRCSLERQWVDSYYVLRTGATWKGRIGDCKVRVDWGRLKGVGTPTFQAASEPIAGGKRIRPSQVGPNWAEFHFKRLLPKFDLEMMWPSGFWNYTINGKSPQEAPLRNEGETQMHGREDDPILDFDAFANLLGTRKEVARVDRLFKKADNLHAIRHLNLRGHGVDFVKDGVIKVDGKDIQIRRVPKYSLNGVYVRDMVKALGGTFEHLPEVERSDIHIRW